MLEAQAAYWRQTLAGAPELLALPTDRARPARQDFAGASVAFELDAGLTAGLTALGRAHGATLFMTLLAGWAVVLARLAGQPEVVIGTPTADRGRLELEGLIGFFVNTLALRIELAGAPTVAELLGRVRERVLGAQQHQGIPFEQVVELLRPTRSLAHASVFQVMLAWQNTPGGSLDLPGVTLGPVDAAAPGTAKFDLALALAEEGGRIVGELEYATALFERATVERHVGYLRRALAAMAADARRRVDGLPLLPTVERRRLLVEWNATAAAYPGDVCAHEPFAAQAARTPGAVAVVCDDAQLTYAELEARANRLAHHLRALGVGPEARVGVLLERSAELVVALLGTLRAGDCYVPLDPGYPAERLAFMLADAQVRVVVTQARFRGRVPAVGDCAVVWLDAGREGPDWAGVAPERTSPPPHTAVAANAAYVIYTSGSSGTPKGVVVPHRAVVRLVRETDYTSPTPADVVAHAAAPSFDAATFEVWGALLNGARLVAFDHDTVLAPERFAAALRAHAVTTLFVTTALFNMMARERPDAFWTAPG